MRRAANVLPAAFLAVLVAGPVVAMAAGSAPPSVETFFRKPAYGGATLSPNGRYLAVVAPIEDHHGLIVLDLETHAATKMKSPGDGDVTSVSWQNDERLLVGIGDLQAVAGEPTRDLGTVAINRDGTDSRVIERGGTSLLRILEGTNSIILSGTDRSRRSLDLFRVDTVNGHRDLLTFDTPGNVVRWVLDFDGVPRAAVSADLDHDESAWYVRKSDKDPWTRVERNAQTDLSLFAERSSLMAAEIGDPKTDRARFRRVSPLANADKVAVPVLLAYGASDRRVPLVHGSDFHGALERAQKEHEWVVYADEGHGFNKDENVFDYYARVDRFLAKYLLPAAQVPAN